MHQSISVSLTSHRFFAWDPTLISSSQNEKKKLRNANFGFYVRHIQDWRRHSRWKKRHCEMRPAYVAFCHSEKDAAFRERAWKNHKDLLSEWTKCHTDIACLPHKPGIRAAHALSKLYGTWFINLKKLLHHGLDDLPFLWKLLQKFIRRSVQFFRQVHAMFHVFWIYQIQLSARFLPLF